MVADPVGTEGPESQFVLMPRCVEYAGYVVLLDQRAGAVPYIAVINSDELQTTAVGLVHLRFLDGLHVQGRIKVFWGCIPS